MEEGWDVMGGVSRGLWGDNGDELRGACWKPQRRASCLASLSVRPCLKRRAAISDSSL